MEQNRDAAEKECDAGRQTLLDQLDHTDVRDFIQVFRGRIKSFYKKFSIYPF